MKKLVSLFLSLILSFATFTLVACDGNGVQPHEHSYGETYIFDKVNHWKECECKEKTEVSTHVDSDSNYKCDVCNYEMERISHSHEFNSNYVTDENNHWKECDCGEKSELGSHVDGDNNGKCDTCSYQMKKEDVHEHVFNPNYVTDENNHWKECTCGEKSELGSHADGDNNGKCDTCSYQMKKEEVHTHNYGSKYLSDENNHWKECSCGDKSNIGSHADSDTNGKCDTCSYQMPIIPEVQGPQTPVIPGHPTSGDSSYLGKTPIEIYTNAMAAATATGNYTFNAHHDIDISLVVPAGTQLPSGYPTSLGYQTMDSVYSYANGEFFGKDEVVLNLMGDTQTQIAQIVCIDNVVYLLAQQDSNVVKIKDNGSYEDLQNSTDIPLDITDNRLYVPSVNALNNAYFNLSSDGATLTVKLSGAEAEEFIEDMNKNQQDFLFSDIVYIVHFDENGNFIKINYLFQIYIEYTTGMYFCYDYDCTVTITDINSTVVNAPEDANTYIQSEFI